MSRDKFDKNADDFWNLDQFVPKRKRTPDQAKQFSRESTSAVEIDLDKAMEDAKEAVEDILPQIDALTASARRIATEFGLDTDAQKPQGGATFSDSRFSDSHFSGRKTPSASAPSQNEDSVITRFIPPHSDSSYVKKHVLAEYQPQNPLIKSVRLISDKPDETLFVESNLFIRERRALLHRKASECAPVSYYSYSHISSIDSL